MTSHGVEFCSQQLNGKQAKWNPNIMKASGKERRKEGREREGERQRCEFDRSSKKIVGKDKVFMS
jgi:hypothetical protein